MCSFLECASGVGFRVSFAPRYGMVQKARKQSLERSTRHRQNLWCYNGPWATSSLPARWWWWSSTSISLPVRLPLNYIKKHPLTKSFNPVESFPKMTACLSPGQPTTTASPRRSLTSPCWLGVRYDPLYRKTGDGLPKSSFRENKQSEE